MKKKDTLILTLSIILTLISFICSVNIMWGLIKSASPDASDSFIYFTKISNVYLSIASLSNALFSLVFSFLLVFKNKFKTPALILICICFISLISVLAFLLI